MSYEPISAGIDLISSIVSKIWPDATEQKKAELEIALAQNETFKQLMLAQIKTNEAEATTGSIFLGGWRSFVGWVCGLAFAWHILIVPVLLFIGNASGHPLPLPAFDILTVMRVLLGMLGIGS